VAGASFVAVASALTPAVAGTSVGSTDQLGRDPRRVRTRGADHLDAFRLLALIPLGSADGDDGYSFEFELGFGLEHVAGLGAVVEQGAVEDALRLTSTRRPPSPGSVGARAGKFDLDPAGHASTLVETQASVPPGIAR
jgi:hypothetical protein